MTDDDSRNVCTACRNERRRGYKETVKWEKHLGRNLKDKRVGDWYITWAVLPLTGLGWQIILASIRMIDLKSEAYPQWKKALFDSSGHFACTYQQTWMVYE